MKKILLLFFLLPVYILASEVSPDLESEYSEAVQLYNEKEFSQSYELLSKLYLTKLSDAKLNFYLGRSAYETGHYEVALAAFERVEMLDSGNVRNKLEMARTYFMLKMYEDSELKFKEILANPNLPQNVRINVELFLSKVTKVQEKSFTYASFDLDFLYDSNVNFGSLDSKYNIGIGTLPGRKSQGDVAFQLFGDIVNMYDIGDRNGLVLKNHLKVYAKAYSKLDTYNIQYMSYTPSLLYKETKYLYEFVLGLDSLYLGGIDYMRTLSVVPRFEYSHTNSLKSMIHFKYQNKSYKQAAQADLAANHYELAYLLQDILTPSSYIQGNTILLQEKKIQGSRDDVDYFEYRFSAIYSNQFSSKYGAEIFGEYRGRYYSDKSTLFNSVRSDQGFLIVGTMNMKIKKHLRLHIKSDYNRVQSNQAIFSYGKFTITTGLNLTF